MKERFRTINIIKWIGFLILLLVVTNMIISVVTNKAGIGNKAVISNISDWTLTLADGSSIDITLPYAGDINPGEAYSISTVLPNHNMGEGTTIFINAVQSDVEVWVGDEKRLTYLGKDMRIALVNAPTRYLFVPIGLEDVGKTVTIQFRSMTRYNGKINAISIATESSVWMYEISKHGISFMLSIFGIVIAICAFGFSFLTFGSLNGKSLRYLSVGCLAICLWLFCEHRLNQLIFNQPLITGIMTYIFVILMPIPMIMYFNLVEGRKNEKILTFLSGWVLMEFAVMTLLSAFSRYSYSVTMPMHHITLGSIIVISILIILKDCFSKDKYIKTYIFSAIGMLIFAACSLIEIIGILLVDFYVVGMYVIPGLIVLVFLTSLQTIQASLEESEKKRKALEQSTINTIRIIAGAIDARDEYTGGHSSRVAYYASTLIKEMGYSDQEINDMYYVGLLHDIGKIGIPDSILNKAGRLDGDEYHLMKFHAVIGAELLSKLDTDDRLIQGIRYHHERYDGKGYPDGLKGEEIPKIARVLCLADSYDAMTSNRVYRNRLTPEQVEEEIMKNAGSQFDPELAKIFCNLIKTGVISPTTYNGFEKSESGSLSKSAVIQRMIMQPSQFAGKNEVSRPEFMRMLMYMLKIAEKNNTESCVILFTLKGKNDSPLSAEDLSAGMDKLAGAMSQTCRSTDVVTRYSENQRVVAVIGEGEQDYKYIANDTIRVFDGMDAEGKYELEYRVVDWNGDGL